MSIESETLTKEDVKLNSEVKVIRTESEIVTKENAKLKFLKKYFAKKIIKIGVPVLVSVVVIAIGLKSFISFYNKTTQIGFEDIGELATQTAYCTVLDVIEKARDLYGVKIPFTQSKYIYSYDSIIKAGFDFNNIKWEKNENNIIVDLPEPIVLSNELDMDSFKIYHEEQSIFNPITMTENNEAMRELKQKAEEDAIANGLLQNARINAEEILTVFFDNVYDLEEYKIIFKDK